MASYLPPIEDVPIFDNNNFVRNNNPLTYGQATTSFLQFPLAQGNETLQDIIVEGTTDLINIAQAHYTMPAFNDTSLIIPSTAWVQDAITNAPANTDIDVTTPVPAGTYYMPMINGSVAGAYTGYVDNGMSYNATTNNLSTTTFTGALVGNATTSTSATSATNATNVAASITALNTSLPILIGSAPTGNISCLTDGGLFYNPSTNNLTTTTFTGALVGNASTATTATTATSATTATTASVGTTTTVTNNANGVNYIPLLNSISGNLGLRTAPTNNPTYNTITGQFTAQQFIGNLTGQSSDSNNAQNVSLTTGDDSAGNWYIPYSKTTANDVNRLYIDNVTTPLSYNPSVGTLNASIFNGALSGNATSATQVAITPNGNNATHYLTFSDTNTAGNISLHTNSGVLVNPSTDTITTSNFSATTSMSSPYYTSPSGGNSRWYSPDNTQYGQIYTSGASNSIYNFIINPAYKLGLTMNTQGASNPGAVNSVYTQGCDIGWNYNGNGSTDFYNNAGLQPTTTHQAFTFWDASTILIQQVIAFLPRIQGSFGATGLSMPTYDWVNGTVSAAISAIPSLNSFNMTAIVPAATNTYYGLWANSATTGSHPIDTGTYVQLVPNTNTISITSNLNVLTTNTSLNNVRTTSTPIILAFGNCDGSASGGADAFNLTSSYLTSTGWTNPSGGLYELTLTGVSHSIFSATITGNAGTSTAGQRPQILTSVAYIGGFTNAYLSVKFQIYYLQGTGGGGAPFNGPFSYSISGIMN